MHGPKMRWGLVLQGILLLSVSLALVNSERTQRIIGGAPVEQGELPFVVAIYAGGWASNRHPTCTGTILSERAILSTANCFRGLSNGQVDFFDEIPYDIVYGEVSLLREDLPPSSIRRLERFVLHPSYAEAIPPEYADVGRVPLAVVFVSEPMDLNGFALPAVVLEDAAWYATWEGRVSVAGWGVTQLQPAEAFPSQLQVVDVPLTTNDECQAAATAASDPGVTPFSVPTWSVCAGGEPGKDSCFGDGGGPLFADLQHGLTTNSPTQAPTTPAPSTTAPSPAPTTPNLPSRSLHGRRDGEREHTVVGLTWTGTGTNRSHTACGANGEYGVYVRVTSFHDWIVETSELNASKGPSTGVVVAVILIIVVVFSIAALILVYVARRRDQLGASSHAHDDGYDDSVAPSEDVALDDWADKAVASRATPGEPDDYSTPGPPM